MLNQVAAVLGEVSTESLRENLAPRDIKKYLDLQQMFPQVDVGHSREFQKAFNGFYRIRQRPAEWYEKFYSLFQEVRFEHDLTFRSILERLHEITKRLEPSFSSKLLATINPKKAVLDSVVMKRLGLKIPAWGAADRLSKICKSYEDLSQILSELTKCREWETAQLVFEKTFPEAAGLTVIKKLDFVLWSNIPRQKG